MERPPIRKYGRIALATLAIILVIGVAVYETGMLTSQSGTTIPSGVTQSSPPTTPVSTSSLSFSTPGEEPTTYTNQTITAQEESTGLLNCTAQEEAFLNEGAIYSELDYPQITGNGDNPFNHLDPAYVYFVQFPNGTGVDVNLGDVKVPMISVCQALGDAISHLGVNPQNYTLAAIFADDAELNIGFPTYDAAWTFSFAMVHQGYWVDSAGGYTNGDGMGYAAQATVYAASGHTSTHMQALSFPSNANIALKLNSTQAIQVVRHTIKMNEGPATVANGMVNSIDLRLATVRAVSGGPYVDIQPVTNSTMAGQLGLVWIITTSIPDYVGFFVVDAQTGQVVEAEGESTLPCGGAPNCGTTTAREAGVYTLPNYSQTEGINVATESFQINGSTLGVNGIYPVDVPNVLIMSPGASGSIGLDITGTPTSCPPLCSPFTYEVEPSISWIPSDISMNFSERQVSVSPGQTVNDTLQISVSPNATQGTYIVFFENPPYSLGYEYIILSVWDGQIPWPVFPMLSVPLFDGQPEPIIFNATSTSS